MSRILISLLIGFSLGMASENTRYTAEEARLARAEQAAATCDAEVLRAQKELNDAREAYWRNR